MHSLNKHNAVMEIGIESLTSHLCELGLRIEVERDFSHLVDYLANENTFANPTYNPTLSDLGQEDFWLRILNRDGRTVACSAERSIYTENLLELIENGRIWYRGGFRDISGPEKINLERVDYKFAGKIGLSGATYTVPEWRRQGLSLIMTWISRLISFRDLGTVLNTGFVRHRLMQTSVPSLSYGYDQIEKIIDGYFPPQRGVETLYLCWTDPAAMVHRVLGLPAHPVTRIELTIQNGSREYLKAA